MEYNVFQVKGYECLYIRKSSEISSVRIIVNAGSVHEDPKNYGIAHLLEHMFFKGSENKTSSEIRTKLSQLGDGNAYTSFYKTVYHHSCLKYNVEDSIDLMGEVFFQPKYVPEELNKERNVVMEELQTILDNPSAYFFDKAFELAIPIYGHPTIGTKETLEAITVKDLTKFYNDHYLNGNLVFAIVTDRNFEDVQRAFTDMIHKYAKGPKVIFRINKIATRIVDSTTRLTHASEQSMIALIRKGPSVKKELQFKYANDVFTNAFGGGLHSMLFDRVREKLGLCYDVWSYEGGFMDNYRTIMYAALKKENINKAIDVIEACFKEVREKGFDGYLLNVAKINTVFSLGLSLESTAGYSKMIADRYFERGIVDPDEVIKNIINVTNTDMIEYANWLNDSPVKTVIMNG